MASRKPWLVAFTIQTVRHKGWRYPALFALTVTTCGSVNATALLLVGMGPLLWLFHAVWGAREVGPRQAVRAALKIGALTILTTVTTWNNFLWPSVVLTKSELMPLAVGILELSGTFGSSTRVIAAGAILTIAPALIVFFLTQRFFMRGMEGAIK